MLALHCALIALVSAVMSSIVEENAERGTRNWWPSLADVNSAICGFSPTMGVMPLQTIQFFVQSPTMEGLSLEIYRLGYYAGEGGRLMGNVSIQCDSINRLGASSYCAATWQVPHSAYTGVYAALPVSLKKNENTKKPIYGVHIPFVVQPIDESPGSDILFKTSDLTWLLYNSIRGSDKPPPESTLLLDSVIINVNVPWKASSNVDQASNNIFGAELAMIFWLEKHGYDVSYHSTLSVEQLHKENKLSKFKVILLAGNDEFTTPALRSALLRARDIGIHLAFFGGQMGHKEVTRERKQIDYDDTSNYTEILRPTELPPVAQNASIVGISVPAKNLVISKADFSVLADPHQPLLSTHLIAMNISRQESSLRIWRNTILYSGDQVQADISTHVAEQSQHGSILHNYLHEVIYTSNALFTFSEQYAFAPFLRSDRAIYASTSSLHNHGNYSNALYSKGSGAPISYYRHEPETKDGRCFNTRIEEIAHNGSNCLRVSHHSGINTPTTLKPQGQGSSLVFGAGTVQWAWALSGWHDGVSVPVNREICQATLNILSDMGVLPIAMQSEEGVLASPLVLTPNVPDVQAPRSMIQHIKLENTVRGYALKIVGKAEDYGGGNIAKVEVSVDAGLQWNLAEGRKRWYFVHYFDLPVESEQPDDRGSLQANPECLEEWSYRMLLLQQGAISPPVCALRTKHYLRGTAAGANVTYGASTSMSAITLAPTGSAASPSVGRISVGVGGNYDWQTNLIMVRAVDDSGWREGASNILTGLCAATHPEFVQHLERNQTHGAHFETHIGVVHSDIVAPNTVLLKISGLDVCVGLLEEGGEMVPNRNVLVVVQGCALAMLVIAAIVKFKAFRRLTKYLNQL